MNSPDSSTLIAAFAGWHEAHEAARESIVRARLIGHTMFEFVSVLSRLPEPHRVDARLLAEWLRRTFLEPPLVLTAKQTQASVSTLVASGVTGGAVYDGLIAFTAAAHGARLISLDHRASVTYSRLGVTVDDPRHHERPSPDIDGLKTSRTLIE